MLLPCRWVKQSGRAELQLPGSCLPGVAPSEGWVSWEYNRIQAAATAQAAHQAEAAAQALCRVRCMAVPSMHVAVSRNLA